MSNKHRCTFCREYFEVEDMLAGGIGGVCSTECLRGLQERARQKRDRRKLHKAQRKTYHKTGRRIPGPERRIARHRDGNRCRWCGTTKALSLHHVIYRSEGGPDKAYNLLTLCRPHHEQAHSNKHLYQPVLLHVLRSSKPITVPQALETVGPNALDEAIKWGRNMRHGQVA